MQFLQPTLLLLCVVALLPWVGPLRTRDRAHALLRSLALLLIVFAAARPVSRAVDGGVHRVVVIDRTESVTEQADGTARELLTAAIAERLPEESFSVVELGGDGRPALEAIKGVERRTVMDAGGSSLGRALEAALRGIPDGACDASVTVLSDGLATDDPGGAHWAAALADAAARGVSVEWTALDGAAGDLRPVGLDVVGVTGRVGQQVNLDVTLVGGGQVVSCALIGPEGELDRAEGIAVNGRTRLRLGFEPEVAGFMDLAVEVTVTDGADPVGGDLRMERTLCVQDPTRVLYLGDRVAGGGAALADLVGGGFQVDVADGMPTAESLDRAELVVLDDRPATAVPEAWQEELVQRVSSGRVGLLAAGGDAAFGPGGFHDQPLEEILPVEFVQKEEKRDPSTTLVVIIDTSGSMGGNRVQLAKEVARLSIRRLLPHDKVGLVEFYGAKRWAVPIQPASNSIEIERALNRLDAGGGTVILPAIEEAYYGLKNVRTRFKHVMILTDGGVETGAFEPLLRRMAQEGMNVSTVLIGSDAHSEFLVGLANWGQGRFYSVPNRFNLPEILLKQPASAKLPAYRPGVVQVRARGGAAWWGEVDPDSTPPLGGYVETRARPGAERVLETVDEGHPILASWRYGLGRVSAMTTEPTGPGTEPWQGWDGYGELMARALARTASDTAAPFAFRLDRDPDGALLVAERRAAAAGARPAAERVVEGADEPDRLAFEQVSPDRFEVRLPVRQDEGLRVLAGAADRPARERLALDALSGAGRELQVDPVVAGQLRAALAASPAAAGGADRTGGVVTLRELSPWLAFFALLAYLLDIAYRRWPRGETRRSS